MRKTLFFAFALAASVLAFVACDKKDKQKEEPIVENLNPILGTWFASDIENDYFYTFNSDGSYQRVMDYYMNGRAVVAHEHIVGDGSYTFENDIVTTKLDSIRISMDGGSFGPFPDFWPAEEKMKFKVEGDKLTLTHDYESGDAWTEVLTKNGKPADQDDPSDIDIDPAKLVKTEWRTDSCFLNGERTAPPHLYIEILSEDAVIMNGENHNFVINKDKMTCTYFDGTVFTIVEVQEGWAHVKGDNGSDIYLSKLPERDYDAMIMEDRSPDCPNGTATGFLPGGKYYYETDLFGKPEWDGQRVMLEFEGVYMNASVTLNNGGFAAICLPFEYKVPEGTIAYIVSEETTSNITLKPVGLPGDVIPYGAPIILGGTAQAVFNINPADKRTTYSPVSIEGNKLKGTFGGTTIPKNSYYLGANGKSMLKASSDHEVSSFRAWLPASNATKVMRSFVVLQPDAIQKVTTQRNNTEAIYDLDGVQVNNPTRGIYIKNNKKILIK